MHSSKSSIESDEDLEVAQNTVSTKRQAMVDEFQLTKGIGVAYVMFEQALAWLLSISPFAFQSMCFPQFNSLIQMRSVSKLAHLIIHHFSVNWMSSQLVFNTLALPKLNFVLTSGSYSFVRCLDLSKYESPIIYVQEFKVKVSVNDFRFKFNSYRHFLNGGCTNMRLNVGFANVNSPSKLTSIQRQLGDFVDYSALPSQRINYNNIETCKYLITSMILPLRQLSCKLALLSYVFDTG